MIHLFSLGDRPLFKYAIKSALNQNEEVYVWYMKKCDAPDNIVELAQRNSKLRIKSIKYELPDCYYANLDDAKDDWSTKKVGSIAPYTDFLRLSIIAAYGGFWMDDDFLMLQNLTNNRMLKLANNTDLICFSDMTYHPQNTRGGAYPCNYLMGTPNDSSRIAKKLVDQCRNIRNSTLSTERAYHTFGPQLINRNVEEFKLDIMPTNLAPSLLQFDTDRYTSTMNIDSFYDIMFLRNSIGIHLTDFAQVSEFMMQDSVLGSILAAINNYEADTIQYVLDKYHEMFGEKIEEFNEYNAEQEAAGKPATISLVALQNIV